ncbi:MAG: polysaccharide ABC transporter ATP-binding protein [Anaerolineaceae bacterium]
MTKPVISVEHLTKQYDLGVIGTGTLSRDLNRWWARVRKQPDPYTRIGQQDAFARIGESILALDDVSFTVQQGEALGIIGRNGAGKSTLLKILSRVTAPTSGVVKVRGRIGSLLEVGTGFHPELTGRENVYLNGAILGMRKEEVTRKFDEIVDFSGVEKFIDTPVKRYSSGMYVRLAFAVAAHLDPEILIVDEVLAVGDAEFQKKCLGKMGDVAGEGRTVLFVSHNMGAIERLCPRTILLTQGQIQDYGITPDVIYAYLEGSDNKTNIFSVDIPADTLSKSWMTNAYVLVNSLPSPRMFYGDNLAFEFRFHSESGLTTPSVGFILTSSRGIQVLNSNNIYLPSPNRREPLFDGAIVFKLGQVPLMEDQYFVSVWFGEDSKSQHKFYENLLRFEVGEKDIWNSGKMPTRNISNLWWPSRIEIKNVIE